MNTLGALLRRPPDPRVQWDRLQERFRGRTLILHRGFPEEWLTKLLREPGGGGHLRIDLRHHEDSPAASPVDWLLHEHVLPLALPLPVMIRVDDGEIRLRHMTRPANGQTLIPSDVRWLVDEMPERYHYRLRLDGEQVQVEAGIPVSDNKIDYDFS